MNANRFHIGIVITELKDDEIKADLFEEAKKRSMGIESTVMANYIILRAESLAQS
ncbi:MAG TPA: hypothetical protein QF379_03885 [SAR86 cluster bacterium]|jgi:hypothetical protein|nr:hypothetical protein [SAR86 cluster bacterium]HJM59001.1 hypothetical protein [SAR86 cluster bacterium]|tara:strand:- start:3886 stop:4050 length:165 start_codon:yes stop_codon:yes gene_type:complete